MATVRGGRRSGRRKHASIGLHGGPMVTWGMAMIGPYRSDRDRRPLGDPPYGTGGTTFVPMELASVRPLFDAGGSDECMRSRSMSSRHPEITELQSWGRGRQLAVDPWHGGHGLRMVAIRAIAGVVALLLRQGRGTIHFCVSVRPIVHMWFGARRPLNQPHERS